MTRQLSANAFDSQTVAAVDFLAAEDADTVLAVWFRMLALAVRDPESCVRLTPGLQMDTAALAGYFHCTAEAVETTVQIMEQLQQLTRDGKGNLQLPARAGMNRSRKSKIDSDPNHFSGEKETEKEKRKEPKEKSKEKKKKDIANAMSTGARAGKKRDAGRRAEHHPEESGGPNEGTLLLPDPAQHRPVPADDRPAQRENGKTAGNWEVRINS